ncbi:MAG: penicillin-binding protein 2, partial [Propionibacteriaceae bacterium]|nr:penicillin-binding protein 2 [Propionibacteriaceae bacterium]
AVQEAAAVASVTNGGTYNQPRVLASTKLADGTEQTFETEDSRRVISKEASAQVVALMEAMAANSTSHTFDVPGYRVGAKTGTALEYDFDCSCFSKRRVVSTIGVAPVENPQYLVYVVIHDPHNGKSGSSVAGPAEQDIMSLTLARYGVAPSATKTPKYPIEPKAKPKGK